MSDNPPPAAVPDAAWTRPVSQSWPQAAWGLLFAALNTWHAWRLVPAFTTDSDSYMDVAGNVRHGLGLVQRVVDFTRPSLPDPMGMWPPVYPLTIAAIASLGGSVELAARAVAVLGYAMLLWALVRLMSRIISPGLVVLTLATITLQPSLSALSSTAWSETLYLALLTLGVLASLEWTDRDPRAGSPAHGYPGSFARGLLLGLACLTRYVGVPVVAGWVLLVFAGFFPVRRGLKRAAWAAGALLPPVLWSVRNLIVFGAPFGPHIPPSGRAWTEVVAQGVSAFRWEFAPRMFAESATLSVAFLVFTAVCALGALLRGGTLRVFAYFFLVHLAIAAAGVHGSAINPLAGRYLMPSYFFGIPLVIGACSAALAWIPARSARRAGIAALLVLELLWLVNRGFTPASSPAHRWANQAERSAKLAELRTLVPASGGPVFSDAGHLVRTATGHSAVEIPTPYFVGRSFTRADRARWEARGAQDAILTHDSFAAPAFADWAVAETTAHFVRRVRGDAP